MKRFVALARVSSREQEREGFSLAVQEDALRRYAVHAGGEIVRLFRIAAERVRQGIVPWARVWPGPRDSDTRTIVL